MEIMKITIKKNPYESLTFNQLCDHYQLLDSDLIDLLEVDKRTLKNWRLKDSAPVMARKLITLYQRGLLSADWDGFYIDGDCLITPLNHRLTAGEVTGFLYKLNMIDSLKYHNSRLENQNNRIKARFCSSNRSIFNKDGKLKQYRLI